MIFVSEKAKEKVEHLMKDASIAGSEYFLRVSVVGGGCSGLSYKMDFDNESKPMDQVFEHNGLKVVTDLKSFLYLVNTTLDFSDGLNGKGFISVIQMPAAVVDVGRALRCDNEENIQCSTNNIQLSPLFILLKIVC